MVIDAFKVVKNIERSESKYCDGWFWDHISKRFFNDTVFEHFRILLISRQHRQYRASTKKFQSTLGRVGFPFFGQVGQQEGATRPKKCTKMVWPSCPGRVGFGRVDRTPKK